MTKDRAVVMDCEFFPCWDWFSRFMDEEKVSLEQYEYFVRTSYRNRAYVAGPNGVICLSVPLEGGRNQRKIMKDIRVCNDENWQALHWKTLGACYRRSVYFEYFEEELRPFYKKEFKFLLDANLESLRLLLRLFQLKKDITLSESYIGEVANDYRGAFLPKERELIKQSTYIQPFSDRNGFQTNLSMLDYLFCCGRWQ